MPLLLVGPSRIAIGNILARLRRLLLVTCSTAWIGFGQGATPLLTLDEAAALAQKQNTQIQISTLDVAKAIEETNQLKTQRLPVFKVYANVGASLLPINLTVPRGTLGNYAATGPIPAEDATIQTPPRQITGFIYGSAAQPLTQLYKVNLSLKQARIGEEVAREKTRQQVQETVRQVKQAYFQLMQIQSQIMSAEVSLKYLEGLAALTDRNLAQETVLKSDSLTVKAKLAQQEYELLTLHNNLDTRKEVLNGLLGRDLRTEFHVQAEPLPSDDETTLSVAQGKALDQRPEMRQAHLQTQKAELDVRRERAEYLPDLSAQVSYLSFPNLNFFPKNIMTAGFLLEWQPFDWGLKRHKTDEFKSAFKQASLSEHDAEQQILLDVNSSFRKLAETRALLKVSVLAQEVEREKLRVLSNLFQENGAMVTDALQQQSSLAQADMQHQQALSSFWNAKASFDRAIGEQ
jgi:outer membrane protein